VVIAPPGTTSAAAVKALLPKATYSAVESEAEALAAVRQGTADAFVYDSPHNAIAFAMDKSGELVLLDQPFTEERLGIGMPKGEAKLLAWINAFLGRLQSEDRRQKMVEKWFQNTDWHWKVR
jgi:ABC-type amino acid transport substrate-binding protein